MIDEMLIALGTGRQVRVEAPFRSAVEEQTEAWGCRLGGLLPGGLVVGLTGDLGAGKTVLARALLRGAGLDPAIEVTSPTFTLMNLYPGPVPLVHVDLYRLESVRDAFQAGIEEVILDPAGGLVVVEWYEKFADAWPVDVLRLFIDVEEDGARRISAGESHG
ncbi:MAG: tRNA (adenosine(37)-N6)-threonylcarbamoyltransferase complex ATPase subunit type 1 TsaE [Deltaproteobacteria bacterium]|nr:tRNA (adenosine(37)-N6)-threonylcarbamoyltransferase complex ATPase subunit type 1 TsaE [Deltaproteobacteria bacterium]